MSNPGLEHVFPRKAYAIKEPTSDAPRLMLHARPYKVILPACIITMCIYIYVYIYRDIYHNIHPSTCT